MSWKDTLKIEKGFQWFGAKTPPKETAKWGRVNNAPSQGASNLYRKWMKKVHEDLDKGNVIIRVMAGSPSSYENGTLTIGDDVLEGTDGKEVLDGIKDSDALSGFTIKASSISGEPSITVEARNY